ncbi:MULTISPECIES: IncP-type conjugal transfer protein TraG [Rhodomicrobium]|uniref:IncP-type conjugal transfer protein TraG n=1 Tax=Rhodomicrobium TaxID=1068 RepID=UPI001AECFA78|nr:MULTISPECIES: IncP-type conjugal transfer protein TraG [Rhodomicrobium]
MSSVKVHSLRGICCFLIVLLCLWGATEWTASALGFHPVLGRPWITLFGIPLYAPWSLFGWWLAFEEQAPHVFARAGALAALGGVLSAWIAIGGGIRRGRAGKASSTYGSARWASGHDIRQAGLHAGKGVILGCVRNRYLRHDGPEHILAVAPTRSGKGVGLVIPTLLTWSGSAVIHDLKGENWALTAGWRARFSDCLLFEPVSPQSVQFNPLFEVRRGVNEVRDVQNIADILVDPEGARERRDHWEKTAHALLVGAILHVLYAEEEKTLAQVAHFLADPARSIRRTLRVMLTTNHVGSEDAPRVHPVIASIARELLNKSENERSGVVSTAMSFLGLYRDPIIAANTAQSDFRIADLMGGPRPTSLYLAVPPSDLSRTRPLIRMLLNQIGRRLTEQHQEHRDERARLLLMLDEFPALGRLDFFESALAFLAGYGIRALLVAQSLNQIDKAYGPNNAILDNCHVRVAFAPNDERTAKRLSDALGTATEERNQRNFSGRRFSAWLSHTTISHQETARPLLTPGEVLQLPQDESLVFLSGIPPIRARKLQYFRDRNFLKRCLPAPALKARQSVEEAASHDWAGSIRVPHPALDYGWAAGEHDEEAPNDRHAGTVPSALTHEDMPALFEDRAEPASPDVDDDSAIIELPGGVRLS